MTGEHITIAFQRDDERCQYIAYCDRCKTMRAAATYYFIATQENGVRPAPTTHYCEGPKNA